LPPIDFFGHFRDPLQSQFSDNLEAVLPGKSSIGQLRSEPKPFSFKHGLQLPFKSFVENSREQGVKFGGGLGLQAFQGIKVLEYAFTDLLSA
jgi:hypothetical protein